MKTHIRRFNEFGIEEFRRILHRVRNDEAGEIPSTLLTDTYLTEIVNAEIKIEPKVFLTRREIIGHVFDLNSRLNNKNSLYDKGMWSWLSAFYFDTICPLGQSGKRKVGEDSRYILNPEEWNKYYRHLLASPTRLYKELGPLAKIYLSGKPDAPGDLFEQLASRQEIASCRGVIEAATLLYWDVNNEKVKKGARNKYGPGILRRFVLSTIPQFQMTYDLNSMSGKELIQLLPAEYEEWARELNLS
jgi:hypothetical protein